MMLFSSFFSPASFYQQFYNMSSQVSLEIPFFRAWSLRPRARRTCSSETEISPKATPTHLKTTIRARRPEHIRLRSEHFLDRIGLRDRSDKSWTASEEEAVVLSLEDQTPVQVLPEPTPVALSPDLTPKPSARSKDEKLRPTTVRGLTMSAPSTPGRKVGVYKRAMLRLGVGNKQPMTKQLQSEILPPRSFTGHMLDRASTILRHVSEKQVTPTSSKSSIPSTTDSSTRRFYIFPLRRAHSNSSSVRNMLMGNAPLGTPTTPDPQVMYIGSDQHQYFRVEISAPGAPTYLPSEARRIATPPLLEQNGRPRGFFFNYEVPDGEANMLGPDTRARPRVKRRKSSDIDWYTVMLKADEARDNAMNFELNVPEHLPSSPLCPKHPKHQSGGRGICVYHGRNRELEER